MLQGDQYDQTDLYFVNLDDQYLSDDDGATVINMIKCYVYKWVISLNDFF